MLTRLPPHALQGVALGVEAVATPPSVSMAPAAAAGAAGATGDTPPATTRDALIAAAGVDRMRPVPLAAAAIGNDAALPATVLPRLPNVLWGEIGLIGGCDVQHQLRSVDRSARAGVEDRMTALTIRDTAQLQRMLASPSFPKLRTLTLMNASDGDMALLTQNPSGQHQQSLRHLILWNAHENAATQSGIANLARLALTGIEAHVGATMQANAIAAFARVPTLTALSVHGRVDKACAEAFAAHDQLRTLTLFTDGLTPAGIMALSRSATLYDLTLTTVTSRVDEQGLALRAFATSPALRRLDLASRTVYAPSAYRAEDVQELAAHRNLEKLAVPVKHLTCEAGQALAQMESLSNLTLKRGSLSEAAAHELMTSGTVRSLTLHTMDVEPGVIGAIARNERLDVLEIIRSKMDVPANPQAPPPPRFIDATPEDAYALRSNVTLSAIGLSGVGISTETALALASRPTLRHLALQMPYRQPFDVDAIVSAWQRSGHGADDLFLCDLSRPSQALQRWIEIVRNRY